MESQRQQETWIVHDRVRYYALALFLQLTCEGLPLKTNTTSESFPTQELLLLSESSPFAIVRRRMFQGLIAALVSSLSTV